MAESVVAFVVERLAYLLLQKTSYLHGMRDQVEEMKNELKWIQCFLKDADSKQEKDERVRLWVSEIREVAYDVDDVIDTYILKIEFQNRKGFVKRATSVLNKWKDLRTIGKEITSIQTRLHNISNNREKYSIIKTGEVISSANESTRRWRRLLPHMKEDSIVALEEDTAQVMAQLMNEDTKLRVISIIGMGGIGKTTLAFKVYNHHGIKSWFDCCFWIYVSKEYNLTDILRTILVEFNGINVDEMGIFNQWSEEQLLREIYVFLESKHYLVVLDDIWSTEAWDVLKPAFPNGEKGSKVMLTSRNVKVALHADSQTKPYEPQCLTEGESWALFCQKAFPNTNCPSNLVELGTEMVKRCGGLPLAIVVLGGLLLTKKTWDEWVEVHHNISWHLHKGDEDRISKILALSYNDLPHHLKSCFLYFSHFPDDSNIRAKKLIRLWVAEGFIPQEREEAMEAAAENCLKELIARCMVQVIEMSFGTVKTCHVHDVWRDFAVAKSKEERFLEILGGTGSINDAPSAKSRRHAIHSDYEIKLPDVIWKMKELRHLLFDINYGKGLRIDTLKNLQTLLSIRYGSSIEQGLINLTNVRKLGIYDLSTQQTNTIFKSVVKLKFLRSLSLSLSSEEIFQDLSQLSCCHRLLKLYLWGRIEVHHPDVFPPTLIKLTLHASQLEQDPMETLGKLPNLVSLKLQRNAYKGKGMVCTAKGFPRLQTFRLLGLYELEEWTVVEGAMPTFIHLEIWDCKNLETLPDGLRFITSLQKLVIGLMPKEFKDRVQGEEELYKVRHIPSITCY
ncbi:hypothetical protein IFM89_005752 [Coptis chinensis]|uniref:Uncharacterized protein n=1 Tax=Coptis chinensis TaxID=261450 RepID=A0A835IP89_9MAGN|nr:hypothetical protein IFM89_005752 [Coptis chinensis]